ncbi:MAG: M1 family aminopeptidase [Candidatus Daviesbacteria bacterium]|nr:M1 family aminopeptidase [Candidatus Daviesbacteria bacterium]
MKKNVRLSAHVKPERYKLSLKVNLSREFSRFPYKIMLKPDLNEFTFTGEETIFLSLEKPTKQITLHAIELEIESAEFIHGNREIWAGKISYNKEMETATFTFPEQIQKGKGKLKLIFKGILNDKMRGFYRSRYEMAGISKHLATTQFESTDARRAFPCFDEPSQKAIFDVTLMIPTGTTAISNTIETVVKEHESGYQMVEFAPTPKMSTYLLAFIVGEFEYVEGKSDKGKVVRVFTTEGKKEQARFALDVARKCLDFYEGYFDIDYPLPVLDMIAIPDFAAGAMENWGAVTYRESTLLIDEERSSTANKQWVALVIAHELAHMWFGDLVTMEWWTHLWLNEGFASFIEYLAIDHIFPEWDIWTQFVAEEMGVAYSLDALKNTHPIEVEVGNPAEISEIFDKVSYSKGASVLRMLMSYLGPAVFQKGLQHYLKKHSYGNAKTEDLWLALTEVSKKPVAELMRNWTQKPGHPVIRLQVTGNRLQLTQSRFFGSPISKKETKDNAVWSIPVQIMSSRAKRGDPPWRIASSPASPDPHNDNWLLMDKKSITFPGLKDNEWIKLNAGEASLVRVDYPQQYLKRLEEAIKDGKLSAPDRLGLIRDSFDLAKSGDSPTSLALELALSFATEEDYTVWSVLTEHLSELDSLLAYEPFYENFRSYGRQIFSSIVKEMGWQKKAGEKHTDLLLRGLVLYKLGSFGDKGIIQKAQELFSSLCHPERSEGSLTNVSNISNKLRDSSSKTPQNDKSIDPDLRSVVYNLAAENGGKTEFDTLMAMYKEEDNQQEKDRIGRALGKFKSETFLSKTLDFAISKHVRFQNSLQIIAAVWNNPAGRYLAWEFVKRNWELLKERYAGGHIFPRIFLPMGNFTKVSDASDIENFIAKNPVPEAKRTVAQALEQIYSNAEWLKRDRDKIKKFLEQF